MRIVKLGCLLLPVGAVTVACVWLLSWIPVAPWNARPNMPETLTALLDATPTLEASAPLPTATPNVVFIYQKLSSPDWQDRLTAAWMLPARHDISTRNRVTILAGMLDREVAAPLNAPPAGNPNKPTSTLLKMEFAQMLAGLGQESKPALRQAVLARSGETQEWLVLALGYGGAHEITPRLQDLLHYSTHWDVRMVAAQLLGTLQAHEAIPDLKQALADPFSIQVQQDGSSFSLFPVRERAAAALEQLGVTVQHAGGDTFRVK
ncbi:MAG: HEAT repeat domain-containing protein [Chloroflexi bacterium]|nr:HEAT repeat domain-containing protein [Chloroflexota bacterium]